MLFKLMESPVIGTVLSTAVLWMSSLLIVALSRRLKQAKLLMIFFYGFIWTNLTAIWLAVLTILWSGSKTALISWLLTKH